MSLRDKLASAFDPEKAAQMEMTEKEREIVSHVKKKVEEIRSNASRIANEGIWMTNIAYLVGYDGLSFNTRSRTFEPVNRASMGTRKARIHVNKILATVQNRAARITKNPPKYDIIPETDENADKEKAQLTLSVLTTKWHENKVDLKRLENAMWLQQCGHSWVKVLWDETKGRVIDDESGEHEGDIKVEVVSPFEIFPNPEAKSDEDVYDSWLIQCKARSLDYFRNHYPERGKEVKEEEVWLLSNQYETRVNSMTNRGPLYGNVAQKNHAVEMIKYEAPSKKYPRGRMIVCANGVLLEDKDLPTGRIPFAKFDDIMVAGKLYPEAVITHLRPIQDQYNLLARRRADWVRKLMTGKMSASRGSGLMAEALNNNTDEVFWYTPNPEAPDGGRPTPIPMPNVPQYAFQEEDRYNQQFNEVSGISEVSKGNLPSASIPAIGMQLLVEQDDTRIGFMSTQHEFSWARVGSLMVDFMRRYYSLPRRIALRGTDGSLYGNVRKIRGEDLAGEVMVVPGSTVPGSKTLKRQEILNAYSQGLLGDPTDPNVRSQVLSMVEYGDVKEIWKDQHLDKQQIRQGIDDIEQEIMPEVNKLDNHMLWISELNRVRKSNRYETWNPRSKEMLQRAIHLHADAQMSMSGMEEDGESAALDEQMNAPDNLEAAPGAEMAGMQSGMEAGGM